MRQSPSRSGTAGTADSPVATTTVNPLRGEIWRVSFPFGDVTTGAKVRPVLILGYSKRGLDQDETVLLAPITSFSSGGGPKQGDVEVPDWKQSGLSKLSWIRARRLWSPHPKMLVNSPRRPGVVSDAVLSEVLVEIQRLFS